MLFEVSSCWAVMEIAEEYRGSVFWEDLFWRDFSNGLVWLVSVLGMSVCGL